jgi:hypothetical protein
MSPVGRVSGLAQPHSASIRYTGPHLSRFWTAVWVHSHPIHRSFKMMPAADWRGRHRTGAHYLKHGRQRKVESRHMGWWFLEGPRRGEGSNADAGTAVDRQAASERG